MKVTVVIRVLNEKDNLHKLLQLLEKQLDVTFEIVIIDSGSTDGTLEMIKKYEFKFPKIITNIKKEEFSFGRSLNKGIEKSTYKEIVISLSAHCFPVDEYYLLNMSKNFDDEKKGLVFGRQVGDSRSPLSEVNHMNKWFPINNLSPGIFCNNGSSAFRYSDWEKIKFDEKVSGCEDILFALELKNKGKDTIYEPKAIVSHYHDENFKTVFNRYRRESKLIKSLFNYKIKLRTMIISILKEVYSDLKYRKNFHFPRSSLFQILLYRSAKNFGQYVANVDYKNFNLHIDKNVKTKLINHYYYK